MQSTMDRYKDALKQNLTTSTARQHISESNLAICSQKKKLITKVTILVTEVNKCNEPFMVSSIDEGFAAGIFTVGCTHRGPKTKGGTKCDNIQSISYLRILAPSVQLSVILEITEYQSSQQK
jgi:hypothetical protein